MALLLKSNSKWWFWAIVIWMLSALLRLWSYSATDEPLGWDGYYYSMQVQSFLETGKLQASDFSLINPYLIGLSWIFNDDILGVKVGSALIAATIGFMVGWLLKDKGMNSFLAMAVLLVCPTLTLFASHYPKNSLGILLLLPLLFFARRHSWIWVLILLILAFFAHRMTAVLAILVVGYEMLKTQKLVVILAVCIVALSANFLPGLISIYDFERVWQELSIKPEFSIWSYFEMVVQHRTWVWWLEWCMVALGLLGLLLSFFFQKKIKSPLTLILILIVIFPFFEMEFGSMGYRFILVLPILLVLALFQQIKIKSGYWLIAPAVFIMPVFMGMELPGLNPPNTLYHEIVVVLESNFNSSDHKLVVAPKGLAEVIIYESSFDALNWTPEVNDSSNLRVVLGLNYHFIKKMLDSKKEKIIVAPNNSVILPEFVWHDFSKAIVNPSILENLDLYQNPKLPRPKFIKK